MGVCLGDEFLVIIKDLLNKPDLEKVIDKISSAIEEEMLVGDLSLKISASIGVSYYPKDAEGIQQLIQIADQQMYKVKAACKSN